MSKNITALANSATQKYAYASAYAIQTAPITYNEEDGDVALFLAADPIVGQTTWPCDSMYFDDAEHALAKLLTLRNYPRVKGPDGEGYPRIVRLELKCDIEAVAVSNDNYAEPEFEIA